ncbi:MAG: hypothetical protein WKF57_20955 [Nakamurella sp.]
MTQAPPPGPENDPGGYPSSPPPQPSDPGQQAGYPAAPPPPGQQGYPAAPPPPAGNYGQPAAPGAYGQPATPGAYGQPPAPAGGGQISFDTSKVTNADWAFFGVGVLMLIFSFFGWVSSSYTSQGGWSGWPVIIQLLLLVTLGIRAAQVFAGKLRKEVPAVAQIAAAGLIVVLTIVALIQIFSETSGIGDGACDGLTGASMAACQSAVDQYSVGPGFGIWAYLILSVVLTYLLVLVKQKEGPTPFKVPSIAGL